MIKPAQKPRPPSKRAAIPPLENGDFLKSREFLRRYERMPEVKKAELVFNQVYMASPVSDDHGDPDSILAGWLFTYSLKNPAAKSINNTTLVLDEQTTVQPDCMMVYRDEAKFTGKRYYAESVDLVVEIAATTASMDVNLKKRAYERAGIREYIVWRVFDQEIDFWRFNAETKLFQPAPPDEKGIWRSTVFPGLDLDVAAALRLDRLGAVAPLQP